MKKLFLSFLMLTAIAPSMHASKASTQLIDELKADLYKVFIQEMWIVSKDFSAMAQGNTELEKDLNDLYANFGSQETAQQKLDAFAKKWQIDAIRIYE